jgi:hypothetical protein
MAAALADLQASGGRDAAAREGGLYSLLDDSTQSTVAPFLHTRFTLTASKPAPSSASFKERRRLAGVRSRSLCASHAARWRRCCAPGVGWPTLRHARR